jgi:ribosome-binding protein aMBF1 (putative translation factor)
VTSFRIDIGARARKAGRFIGRVRSELLSALSEERDQSRFTQQALATKLGVNRSVINRQLSGEGNLTLRSVADLAWALDREIVFELKRPDRTPGQNAPATPTTQGTAVTIVGAGSVSCTTLASPKPNQGATKNTRKPL